eukprot:5771798-Ditylum_brightwellii.AAC.1
MEWMSCSPDSDLAEIIHRSNVVVAKDLGFLLVLNIPLRSESIVMALVGTEHTELVFLKATGSFSRGEILGVSAKFAVGSFLANFGVP